MRKPVMNHSEQILESFFDQLRSGSLFGTNEPRYYLNLRDQVREALFDLLLSHRPELETTKGLEWPYDGLKKNAGFLENCAREHQSGFIGYQARLFLALLPFPGQWNRLALMENDRNASAEIAAYTADEKKRIAAKLRKKKQKKFKLRHFCQILKSPRMPHEKGVLRIFSLPYLFSCLPLLKDLDRDYFLYVEPPWGVLARHAWLRVFSQLDDPVLFGTAGEEDARFLQTQPNILTTRLAHADYMAEEGGRSFREEKKYDLLFNATFDDIPRKRHLFVLDLLEKPELRNISALFIGRGDEENVRIIQKEIQKRNLEKRVTVKANIMRSEVPAWLAQCHMGIQVSLHENGPRSIHEYFRADLPCLVTSSMAGVNFDLFNRQTGRVVRDADMANAVLQMLEQRNSFTPRKWFLANSGSRHSSRQLNGELKRIFCDIGYEWTEDIVPLDSSGANRYADAGDYKRFKPAFTGLLERFKSHGLAVRLDGE